MRNDIQLDQLRIASPCAMDWERMEAQDGDEHVRHCGSCDRSVYDISGMTAADARRLIDDHEGRLCVRLYRRADGTVLTADCPIGRRAARWAAAKVAAWALLIAGTITGTAAAMRSADANTAMSGARGSGTSWVHQSRAYQAFQRWLNPTPPAMMLGTPMLMGEMAGPVLGKLPGPILGDVGPPLSPPIAPDELAIPPANEDVPADHEATTTSVE